MKSFNIIECFPGCRPTNRYNRTSRIMQSHWKSFRLATSAILLFALMMPCIPAAQDDFDSIYDKACLYFRQAQYNDALKYYKRANKLKQDASPECLLGMAQTYSKLGAYKNTLKTCDRLIQVSGDNLYYRVKAWNLKGNELSNVATKNPENIDEKQLSEAATAYREVLKLSGSNIAHYNLGITLIRINQINEGIAELKIYIQDADEEDLAEKARKIIQEPRRAVEDFAPDFSFVTADGEYISTEELKGKVLLLDFWGAWCKPCRDAVPFLSKMAKKYREDAFILISVDANDEETTWRQFIKDNEMDWTHTRDGDRKIQQLFQINAFPTYILIDHEGIIQYRGMGSTWQTEDEISNQVKKSLKLQVTYKKQQDENIRNEAQKPVSQSSAPIPAASLFIPPPSKNISSTISPVEKKTLFYFRIPKPSIEITRMESPNLSSGARTQAAYYRLTIRNWASLPDDLFTTAKDLMACSSGGVVRSALNSSPKRLEIIVKDQNGTTIRGFCDPPSPQVLNSLLFTIPNQRQTDKVFVMFKDRLTGNTVQSDPIGLPGSPQ